MKMASNCFTSRSSLPAGVLAGMEALLRLRPSVAGTLILADFISVAEDSGLIFPLGAWALRAAAGSSGSGLIEAGLRPCGCQ